VDLQTISAALDVLVAHRAAHAMPLRKADMGLRSMVRSEGADIEVSQRLKRLPKIVEKLGREPTLSLAKMQDIAGCRAVLNSIDEERRVQARLVAHRPPISVSDYVATPRSSGYRGVHVIVEYDGRPVEVQLRTRVMHEWAITVERVSARIAVNLKGDGEHAVQQLLQAASEAMAIEERGGTVGGSLMERMEELRRRAAPYLEPGGRA